MFNLPVEKNTNIDDITNINKIINSNYYANSNNNQTTLTTTTQLNNIISTKSIQGMTKMSKRGRPPKKNTFYYSGGVSSKNVDQINNMERISTNKNNLPQEDKNLNDDEIEEISAYIYDENKEENLIGGDEDEDSEKRKKPDSIQLLAINLLQAGPNMKRKSPYSKSQSSNEDKDFQFNNRKIKFNFLEKKFKFLKDYQIKNQNEINFNNKPEFQKELINVKTLINLGKNTENINILNNKKIDNADVKSVKSNDTDDAFNCTELFATYDHAKAEIKKSSGDMKKLKALHFGTDSSNNIVVSYEHLTKKKLEEENHINNDISAIDNIPSNISFISKSTNLNNTTDNNFNNEKKPNLNLKNKGEKNNDSILIALDEYSFDLQEDYLKKDFIKMNNRPIPKKKNFL